MSFFGKDGLFGDQGEILFFIILFLLLFYCGSCGTGAYGGYGCSTSAVED